MERTTGIGEVRAHLPVHPFFSTRGLRINEPGMTDARKLHGPPVKSELPVTLVTRLRACIHFVR